MRFINEPRKVKLFLVKSLKLVTFHIQIVKIWLIALLLHVVLAIRGFIPRLFVALDFV